MTPCYASVLAHGPDPAGLARAVRALEAKPIASCFTAWCSRCDSVYMLATAADRFPCLSAHHTHQLALYQRLAEAGILGEATVFKKEETN